MKFQKIHSNYQSNNPIIQVLYNRGFSPEEAARYLDLSPDDEYSPLLLKNMDQAIDLINQHITEQDHIHIQVDEDCDGYTSSAILLNCLFSIYPELYARDQITYSFHAGKAHGINIQSVPTDTTLLITPDSSSNEYFIHRAFQNRGIDVLVLDHHLADHESEYACVVNNQLCEYPNKALSGAGIVYKLCERFDERFGTSTAKDNCDLAMLGLVGDVMDMRSIETRQIVNTGIDNIHNPFIAKMKEKNSFYLNGKISPLDIAFYIVPYVNAVARMGTIEEKKVLFRSMLTSEAFIEIPSTKRGCKGQTETIVDQAVRMCGNVKARQTKARDAGVAKIEAIIKDNNLLDRKLLLIRLPEDNVEHSIIGLIANELMNKYQRPTAILYPTQRNGEKAWSGSARGYDKGDLKDFRQYCRDSGLVYLAEGHANAFGFGILDSKFDEFVNFSEVQLAGLDFTPQYNVDFVYDRMPDAEDMFALGEYEDMWGQGIDQPLIAVTNAMLTDDMVMLMSRGKNPTIKINFSNGSAGIKFKSSEEEFSKLCLSGGCAHVNLIGRVEINRYMGKETPQLIIEDYEILSADPYIF